MEFVKFVKFVKFVVFHNFRKLNYLIIACMSPCDM